SVGAGLAPARVTIPETPLPLADNTVGAGLAPARVTIAPEKIPTRLAQPQPLERRIIARRALALFLLALFLSSSLLLWRDINDAHLYLYHINPLNGQIQAQQDLGGGYQNAATLTNPVLLQSS